MALAAVGFGAGMAHAFSTAAAGFGPGGDRSCPAGGSDLHIRAAWRGAWTTVCAPRSLHAL